jgi:esterase/lipase superfamily enzyme
VSTELGAPVKVYFATNRGYQGGTNPDAFFANAPTTPRSRLRYGWHNLSVGPKGIWGGQQLKVLDRPDWVEMIRSEVDSSANPEPKTLVVFVHGYNNTFTEAAITTAKLQQKFGTRAIAICYTWPSRGQLSGYDADQNETDSSRGYFANFITGLRSDFPDQTIAVVAHSMGSRIAVGGVQKLPEFQPAGLLGLGKEYPLQAIALLASDLDRSAYEDDYSHDINKRAKRIFIYVSSKDKALQASSLAKDVEGRLGQPFPSPYHDDRAETIDASGLNAGFLGHGYITDRLEVLDDLTTAILEDRDARQRENLSPAPSLLSPKYWRLNAY